MTLQEMRQWLTALRQELEKLAVGSRDSALVLDELDHVYGNLGSDRALADQVLIEWLGSEDEGARFDALHLVRKFRVTDARDVLRRLHDRLGQSSAPGAPFEQRRIAETLAELGGHAHGAI